jgi:hypothetical protein
MRSQQQAAVQQPTHHPSRAARAAAARAPRVPRRAALAFAVAFAQQRAALSDGLIAQRLTRRHITHIR